MSKVLVTESSLAGIAAAIREKNGSSDTYNPGQMAEAIQAIPTGTTPTGTVNINQNGTVDVTDYASAAVAVPNSYAAGDEGKVVSNGALVAQTARASEITANGTYDTTTNNSVTVNVAGGGSSKNIAPVSYINSSNIVAEFTASGIGKDSGAGISTIQPTNNPWMNSLNNDCFFADMGEANRDQTIYAVVKSLTTGGNYQGVGSNYAGSSGNAPNIFTSNSKWNTSVYGGDANTGITSTVFHVLSISVNATTKKVVFYIDGVSFGEKSFNNCGRYPSVAGGTINGTDVASTAEMAVLYGAIVAAAEDSATVIANHQTLMSIFSSYIGT